MNNWKSIEKAINYDTGFKPTKKGKRKRLKQKKREYENQKYLANKLELVSKSKDTYRRKIGCDLKLWYIRSGTITHAQYELLSKLYEIERRVKALDSQKEKPKPANSKPCVYFISDGQAVKIGMSMSVQKRIKELQTSNKNELRLIKQIKCKTKKDARKLEKELHKKYKEHKLRGEWFNLKVLDSI